MSTATPPPPSPHTLRCTHYCMQTTASACSSPACTRLCHRCHASDLASSHGAGLLTDFHTSSEPTWWQSQFMYYDVQHPNSVNITLHLGKAFEITYVRLKSHTSRPESFAIYKRLERGGAWLPYQCYSGSCLKTYGRDPRGFLRAGQDERAAACTDEFRDISPLTGGNVALSTLEGRPSAYNFDQSAMAASVNANLSGDFTPAELKDVMAKLKQGKAPGPDNIHPEFVTHQCEITSAWLCAFFSACLRRSKLPRTWRRAAVIALLKPNKPADDPKSYRPISLLCVPFKILERMIHSRIEPVVDSQLPKEQAGFRRGRSTVDQVTLLTQDLEDSFQAKAKAGVVLLDLTAAYDTVWHRGLHLKLLRTIPDRHMVNFIMEMLSNRSFILQTSDGQRSRLRRLRNGVPQGSVLSPMLFNIYIFDLPVTTSRRYGYADDLAIMLHQPTWKAVEEGLNQDMDVLAAYLRSWRLQLSTGKTVSAVFHLCNREARRELEISVENKPLEFQQAPKYLGVRLDRTLSYKQHLDEVRAKVTARVSLIRRLAGTTWGASAKVTSRREGRTLAFHVPRYF
ncbi:hypothetical protein NHX12_027404 [Muraenolepis orangiensis]|uniref:Reverse transcriptase domain-containing protein n=1 Tax=Muraenolepis orangiensis TaxID=630683 RepID=A0A9Q0EIY1_9TELE|nr:hypothetical protein NHX12_027404 [Muraenolepis orangiensis]